MYETKHETIELWDDGKLVAQFKMETKVLPKAIESGGRWYVPEQEELHEDRTTTWVYERRANTWS